MAEANCPSCRVVTTGKRLNKVAQASGIQFNTLRSPSSKNTI